MEIVEGTGVLYVLRRIAKLLLPSGVHLFENALLVNETMEIRAMFKHRCPVEGDRLSRL
jgi:hypothetical protein